MTQKIYFIADLHLGHKNILTLANRRFDSIQEHDSYLIDCINKTVSTSDHLYILGDLGFHKDYLSLATKMAEINTHNVHIIRGNHDDIKDLIRLQEDGLIVEYKEMKIVKKGNNRIFCCHYPMREWYGFYRGYYHAFGHVHNTLQPYERSMDVGVDSIGYHPIEFDNLVNTIDSYNEGKISKISAEDKMINEFFPNLNVHYFVGLCTGTKEIRDKIYEVLGRR